MSDDVVPIHPVPPPASADAQRLIHELRVHQVELEQQQEELTASRAESEETRRRYAELFDFAPVAYLSLDRGGRVLEANRAAEVLLGQPSPLLLGQSLSSFVRGTERTTWSETLHRAFETHERQQLEMAVTPLAPGAPSDESCPTQADLLVPMDTQRCLVSLTDLRAHVRSETALREMERAIQDGQRMEAVGRLAGGIAHDFNNLLTIINGHSEVLLDTLPPGSEVGESIQEIARAGSRAAALTRQLLTFSRKQVLTLERLDLVRVVREVASMLARLVGEHITMDVAYPDHPLFVRGNHAQLEQILVNLVVNARDAMTTGGTLTLQLDRCDAGPDEADGLTRGPHARLRIRDTGTGMAAETQARAFEPFFSTKPVGSGTGLGLSIAYGIVRQAEGAIVIDSAPSAGTTVFVYLPLLTATSAASEHAPEAPRPAVPSAVGSETILVAEDEVGVRTLVVRALTGLGYRVLVAANGAEALQLARTHGAEIHLLLTDVVMPQMSGRELATILLRERPRLRVLFSSGYTDDMVLRQGIAADEHRLLHKPYTQASLARAVRDSLDAPRRPSPL